MSDGRKNNGHKETLNRGNPKTGAKKDKLLPPEIIFIERYIMHWNVTLAAKEAGYSEKSSYSTGHKLIRKPRVKEALEARIKSLSEDYRQDHRVLANYLTEIIYKDYADILDIKTDANGKSTVAFKSSEVVTDGTGKYINSVTIGRNGVRVDIFSKQAAAEMLAKHIGFFKEDNEQRKPDGAQIYLPDNGRAEQ